MIDSINDSFIGIGSNEGNRFLNIERALRLLREDPHIKIKKISNTYETKPIGYHNQRFFINIVLKIATSYLPLDLLHALKDIERKIGRRKTVRFGPRPIDLDILFFDNVILKRKGLTIPHPRLHKRLFVLKPLADIGRDFIHPKLKKTIKVLLKEKKDEAGKEYKKDIRLYRPIKKKRQVHRFCSDYGLSAPRAS